MLTTNYSTSVSDTVPGFCFAVTSKVHNNNSLTIGIIFDQRKHEVIYMSYADVAVSHVSLPKKIKLLLLNSNQKKWGDIIA